MSETLETMLEAMPDSYQKTVGFPTYDLLAAAAIPMEELEAQLQETAAKLDPANLTGEDLERYVKSWWNGSRPISTPAARAWERERPPSALTAM